MGENHKKDRSAKISTFSQTLHNTQTVFPTLKIQLCSKTVRTIYSHVALICQTTVFRGAVMLRFEAIRTEHDKISYQPLKPHQDCTQMERQVRAWRTTLMLFVRIQR